MNHRRPNPDELTPDDLFRPADGGPTAVYGASLPGSEAQSASTQYLPPMPAAPAPETQPYGGQPGYAAQTQAYQGFPQHQAQPAAYGRPHEQPQYESAQPQYEQPQYEQGGYEQGGYEQGGYEQQYDAYGYDDDPRRNRLPMRTLTIAVVAGCAVVGIGLGALLSGGGSASGTAGKGGTAAKHGTSAGGPGDKAAELAQAQKLSQLLETASSNRLAVVNAVAGVQACQALPQAQATLTSAAQSRADLVTQLGQLQVGALPSGPELVAKLTAGWQASQQADSHYAAWAAESAASCQKQHHPKDGGEALAAVRASSDATIAKRDAAELWNRIASANKLPTKSPSQL